MKFNYTVELDVDTQKSGRTYHTPDGSFPSVTTILGKTSPNQIWLQRWRERVGDEEADRVSQEAREKGEILHDAVEKELKKESVDYSNIPPALSISIKQVLVELDKGLEEIWGQEVALWSKKYQYAGRADIVGVWKGQPAIIDLKTSKKPKKKEDIKDYYLQCCAYAVAHNEMFGTGIKNMAIVMVVHGQNALPAFEMSAVPFLPELKNRLNMFKNL